MSEFNFDHCCDRRKSDARKYRQLSELYGRDDLNAMWIADMDFEVAPAITEALRKRIDHPVYGYAMIPDDFFPSILDWLDHRHGFKASREEITFVPGIVRALGYLVNRLTNEGDKVIIQPPVYHPFHNIVADNGRVTVESPLKPTPDGFYTMDPEGFEETVKREKPKVFILCNPHNPIGIQWSEEDLRHIARVCRENNVTVISDEIHADLMVYGNRHIPYMSVSDDARHNSIMLGAPSKTFNIAGIESSWMIIKDPELRQRVFPWMEVNEFSSPTFTATTATIAAYRHGEAWLDAALRYIEANIDHLAERIEDLTNGLIKVVKPQASFLAWLDCRALGLDAERLNDLMVNGAKLALNNGSMFGPQGSGFMRINLGAPRYMVDEAIDSLVAAVERISALQEAEN